MKLEIELLLTNVHFKNIYLYETRIIANESPNHIMIPGLGIQLGNEREYAMVLSVNQINKLLEFLKKYSDKILDCSEKPKSKIFGKLPDIPFLMARNLKQEKYANCMQMKKDKDSK